MIRNMLPIDLHGKAAIVTGSGRGIGRAIAEKIASAGASVLVNDLDEAACRETVESLRTSGARVEAAPGDLTAGEVPQLIADACLRTFGSIDIVVNNAGYTWDNVIQKTTDEQFQAMLDIHLIAPFRLLRAAAPYIREAAKEEIAAGSLVMRKVVNITSISGTGGNPGQAGYSSGKAGVIGLTKTLAKEWGRFNVNVNAVGFGLIETRLIQPLTGGDASIDMKGRQIPVGVQPDVLANVKKTLPSWTSRHTGRSRQRRPVSLLSSLRLRHRRSFDLRRRTAFLDAASRSSLTVDRSACNNSALRVESRTGRGFAKPQLGGVHRRCTPARLPHSGDLHRPAGCGKISKGPQRTSFGGFRLPARRTPPHTYTRGR